MRKENARKTRREDKVKCTFYGYDAGVVLQAPAYVQAYWQQHGDCLTHRGDIWWKMIEDFRVQLVHGMSGLGFQKSIAEKYKQQHMITARKWRSYCNTFDEYAKANNRNEERVLFYNFEDPGAITLFL